MGLKLSFIIMACFVSLINNNQKAQICNVLVEQDTTIVGKVLDQDSLFLRPTYIRSNIKYYYGVHHVKVGVIDYADSLIKDTIVLAYVFNNFTDRPRYANSFGLKIGQNYVFTISKFRPCHSDFPKIQGTCDTTNNIFFPQSNKLIKSYSIIYRVIYASKWQGKEKSRAFNASFVAKVLSVSHACAGY